MTSGVIQWRQTPGAELAHSWIGERGRTVCSTGGFAAVWDGRVRSGCGNCGLRSLTRTGPGDGGAVSSAVGIGRSRFDAGLGGSGGFGSADQLCVLVVPLVGVLVVCRPLLGLCGELRRDGENVRIG